MFTIKQFMISKLFGHKDASISFDAPILIYIGENGLGKTTLLNTLYYLLSLNWKELVKIPFESISVVINNVKFVFHNDDIAAYLKSFETARKSGFSQYLNKSLDSQDIAIISRMMQGPESFEKMHDIKNYLSKKGFIINASTRFIYESVIELLSYKKDFDTIHNFTSLVKTECPDLMFFPTYRRIERNISSIIRNLMESDSYNRPMSRILREEIDELAGSSDYIHYGMQDIDKKINEICNLIRTISREKLDDLSIDILKTEIREQYQMERTKFSEEDIKKLKLILNRQHIGLLEEDKNKIWNLLDTNSIYDDSHKELLYLLGKLLVIYDSYAKYDKAIKSFASICNNYLFEKNFVFDESSLQLKLYRNVPDLQEQQEEIALDKLSSGEKQIVSIFAEVYLNHIDKDFIFLIDEPELSLSIYWQRTLLPDIVNSKKCTLLFAVTHSPFIFDNDFDRYTMGMRDFMNLSKRK